MNWRMVESPAGRSQSGRVTIRMVTIVVAAACALLLVWLMNQPVMVDVFSSFSQTATHPVGNNELIPETPRNNRTASANGAKSDDASLIRNASVLADSAKVDITSDYASFAAIAAILSSESDDDYSLPSEDVLRHLDDAAIEQLVETNLAERYERISRLIEFQPELVEGLVTGLRVIPRDSSGADLLPGIGLLQNDIIVAVEGKKFSSFTLPENLAGAFLVNLLTASSTRLQVLRGGSETLVVFEPGMLDSEGNLVPH